MMCILDVCGVSDLVLSVGLLANKQYNRCEKTKNTTITINTY